MEYFIQFYEYTYFLSAIKVLERSMDLHSCAINTMEVCFELFVCTVKERNKSEKVL